MDNNKSKASHLPRAVGRPSKLTNIGGTLKSERLALGYTQQQMASQLNISLKALRNLEQGNGGVTISTASQILEYFGKELRVGDIVIAPALHPHRRPRRDEVLETLRVVKTILQKKYKIKNIYFFLVSTMYAKE